MIRITKSPTVPSELFAQGQPERDSLVAQFDQGIRSFEFKREIYGLAKEALLQDQHRKCAYCESRMLHVTDGDVEHFRSKSGYQQKKGAKIKRPGYYWLAYEWSNLLIACDKCNRKHKKSLFPLVDESRRAKSHLDGIDHEEPVLIDPTNEDPEDMISFRYDVPYPVNGNFRGDTTITIVGLDREDLNEMRREHLDKVRYLQIIAEADPPLPETGMAASELNNLQQAPLPYTACVRAFLRPSP